MFGMKPIKRNINGPQAGQPQIVANLNRLKQSKICRPPREEVELDLICQPPCEGAVAFRMSLIQFGLLWISSESQQCQAAPRSMREKASFPT